MGKGGISLRGCKVGRLLEPAAVQAASRKHIVNSFQAGKDLSAATNPSRGKGGNSLKQSEPQCGDDRWNQSLQ